jgi:hypothetical protein
MKRTGYFSVAFLACALALASAAAATPNPNSAIVVERIYNDCPISTVTSTNTYPGLIQIHDTWDGLCVGFANLHSWSFSADGGATSANLGNNGNYKFSATVTLNSSPGTVEGGLQLAPWWSNTEGRFQARIPDGEVACFGGRLPFYSFTVNNGVVYTAGTPIRFTIEYHANGLSMASPASIQYTCEYGPNTFSSPVLLFDEGNTAEDPPHGLWGSLDPTYAGGVVQVNNGSGGSQYDAKWENITFDCLDCVVPTQKTTWGRVKTLYR